MSPTTNLFRLALSAIFVCLPACEGGRSGLLERPEVLTQQAQALQEIPTRSDEESWDSQVAAVLAGDSDTIIIRGRVITEEQCEQLPQLSDGLEQLLIDSGGITDAALEHIAELPRLRHLRIRESQITDTGLELLVRGHLNDLQILNIPQSQITAAGIASLAGLPSLTQLRLGGQQLDDQAVAEIAKLPELRSLHLIGPSLSGQALDFLAGSPRLSSFYLDDCPLENVDWEKLFTAKPKLHVHVDQHHHDRDPSEHRH